MFNTLFGSVKAAPRKLNYIDPKIDKLASSAFTDAFLAEDVAFGTSEYLRLGEKENATKYLRVDTTVYNEAGNPYLTFAYSAAKEYNNAGYTTIDKRQHHFRMVYLPSVDSLIVNVEAAFIPKKGDNLKDWSTWGPIVVSDDSPANIALNHNKPEAAGVNDDPTYLVVQNLTETKYCLTVGKTPVQIHIGLNFTGCTITDDNRTTLQGLFVIKNEKGEYLHAPIFTDTTSVNTEFSAPQWVKLENYVDPFQMPSFQWVVEKQGNTNSTVARVNITSREYGTDIPVENTQLFTNESAEVFGKKVTAEKDKGFIPVPEAQRKDAYLGYKHIPEDIAKLRTYTFEYLHFSGIEDHFLSVKNHKTDSSLYIQKDAADAFELSPYHHDLNDDKVWSYAPVKYGYAGALNQTIEKGYIAELVRTAYTLKIKEGSKLYNTNKVVVKGKDEDRNHFVVTSADAAKNYIEDGDSAVFYLKTNNTKEGRNYYALVDTSSLNSAPTLKLGVADNESWAKAENIHEIRTSAFAVELNDEPLYRRFNRTTDGAIGAKGFYEEVAGADDPDTLRFFRVNNEREFLFEDALSKYSKGKDINFLGVKHVADFNLEDAALAERTAFFVDTAFVNRPAVKGSEFDTPKPQYLLGVGTKRVEGTITDIPCEPSVTTPFYVRGRYLINATDSVYGYGTDWKSNWNYWTDPSDAIHSKDNNNDGINDYIWDTRWERLAFVDAIHLGDTLYVLNGREYPDPVNFNDLRKDSKVRAIRLDNNLHKDVVFSFRLINTEKGVDYADQVQDFLIESETEDRGKEPMIAPFVGGWVKIQNGVPVISRGFWEDAITDAERFNSVKTNANPVSNETIDATEAVKVIAGNGEITILNAAGKTVAISNILGQTVANTVINSDNATITAPKGIVVVAIQGEDAIKAIVK